MIKILVNIWHFGGDVSTTFWFCQETYTLRKKSHKSKRGFPLRCRSTSTTSPSTGIASCLATLSRKPKHAAPSLWMLGRQESGKALCQLRGFLEV